MRDCKAVWTECLATIKAELNEQEFNTWFSPIKPVSLHNQTLTVLVPSQYFYDVLEERFARVINKALLENIGSGFQLEYEIVVDTGGKKHEMQSVKMPSHHNELSSSMSQNGILNQKAVSKDLNGASKTIQEMYEENTFLIPNYNFSNYIEGDCNRLARAAGLAISDNPGKSAYNPLIIYGGVGLGKTHLLHAIGNRIYEKFTDKKIVYVSIEKFTNQFIEALKSQKIPEFTNFYCNLDVLLIDDIQFLAGKEKIQDIFFHVFNQIHLSNKQIVITSDCPPNELKGMHERLLSRFKWGLSADLQQPDLETRIAIIQKKLQNDGVEVPHEIVEYIASNVRSNIRELEGVMISLLAQTSLTKRAIDIDLARKILHNIVNDVERDIDINFIQKVVSEFFNIPVHALKDKSRKREIVIARQVAMYFAKELTEFSLVNIGKNFGGRDHSTVLHSIKAVEDMIKENPGFRTSLEELKARMNVTA